MANTQASGIVLRACVDRLAQSMVMTAACTSAMQLQMSDLQNIQG